MKKRGGLVSDEVDGDGVGAALGPFARAMREHLIEKKGKGKGAREKVQSAVEQKRDRFQAVLVSATLTAGVQKLGRFCLNPHHNAFVGEDGNGNDGEAQEWAIP